jgi:hypothetical protein
MGLRARAMTNFDVHGPRGGEQVATTGGETNPAAAPAARLPWLLGLSLCDLGQAVAGRAALVGFRQHALDLLGELDPAGEVEALGEGGAD